MDVSPTDSKKIAWGILLSVFCVFLIVVFAGGGSDEFNYQDASNSFKVGDFRYQLVQAEIRDKINDSRPNGTYLVITIRAWNEGENPAAVPSISLTDYDRRKYRREYMSLNGDLYTGDLLNPGCDKVGFIIFDIKEGNKYILEFGGWGDDKSHIQIPT